MAEIAEQIGLPPGVLNVLTADREVSESLVRDPRVDKIAFTGSTAAGRRIASIMGERIGRYTLELGGKSAAVILDDMDIGEAAASLSGAECFLSGIGREGGVDGLLPYLENKTMIFEEEKPSTFPG